MSIFVAALPMYDWPESRDEADRHWTRLRDRLRAQGIAAPERLARRNGDLPAVPGGIRNASGAMIASDPATLPPDEFDLHTLWRHPNLLFAQTCWGPMELGLQEHVQVVGQPDYSAFEGGQGEFYSSAILMRRHRPERGVRAPRNSKSLIPLARITGGRLAFNSEDSMSGIIALTRDLEMMGSGLHIFSGRIETGSHRASVAAVVEGRADVCALDCRTWDMIKHYQPELSVEVMVAGWTVRRKGLPLIAASSIPASVIGMLRAALMEAGMLARAA